MLDVVDREVIIRLVVGFHSAFNILRVHVVFAAVRITVLYAFKLCHGFFHVLAQLFLRHVTFASVNCHAHEEEISVPAFYLVYVV